MFFKIIKIILGLIGVILSTAAAGLIIFIIIMGAWRRCLLIYNYPFSLKLSFLIYIKNY